MCLAEKVWDLENFGKFNGKNTIESLKLNPVEILVA